MMNSCQLWQAILIHVPQICDEKGILFLWYFFKNPQPWANHEKARKPRLRDILQNIWPVLFKNIKVIKNKKEQSNSPKLEESKEIQWLNTVWLHEVTM